MHSTSFDGYTIRTTDEFNTSPGYQFAEAVERFTQKYLKFFLGAGIVALAWAWSGAFQHADNQVMQDYAIQYLNEYVHAH